MNDHQCTCGHVLSHHAHGHRCLRNVSAYRACPCEHFEIVQAVPECPNCGHVHGGRAPSGRCYHLGERDTAGQREACRCTSTEPVEQDDDFRERIIEAIDDSYDVDWTSRSAANLIVQRERERREALALARRAAVLHPMPRREGGTIITSCGPTFQSRPEYPEPRFDWPELGEIAAILGIDIVKAGDHQ